MKVGHFGADEAGLLEQIGELDKWLAQKVYNLTDEHGNTVQPPLEPEDFYAFDRLDQLEELVVLRSWVHAKWIKDMHYGRCPCQRI